jgi:hypothetical protein
LTPENPVASQNDESRSSTAREKEELIKLTTEHRCMTIKAATADLSAWNANYFS